MGLIGLWHVVLFERDRIGNVAWRGQTRPFDHEIDVEKLLDRAGVDQEELALAAEAEDEGTGSGI